VEERIVPVELPVKVHTAKGVLLVAHTGVVEKNMHYRKGLVLLDQGQYALAAAEFEKALKALEEHDPTVKLVRFHLGQARAQLGVEMLRRRAPERAEEELRHALEINPNYPDLHYNLARALSNEGRTAEALAELDAAIEANPAYAKAYFERGMILCRMGDFKDGMEGIGHAVEMDSAYSCELYDAARILWQAGNMREALDRLCDLASTNVDDIQYHFNLGRDCYRNGWYDRAATEFRKALSIHPGYADVRNELGLALLAMGKDEDAREEFVAALDINPKFLAATINAGDACEAMGDKDSAAEYYEAALELDPSNTEATKRLAKLK
jgi:superkiller protein 3